MFKGFFERFQGSGDQLLTAVIKNRSLGCDPASGLGRLTWTTAGTLVGATIELYGDAGSGFVALSTGVNPVLGILNFDCSGLAGFTLFDAVDFRVNLIAAGLDLQGSPIYLSPPYACV